MNMSNQVSEKYGEILSIIVTRADDKRVITALYDNKIERTMQRFTLCAKCKSLICRKLKQIIFVLLFRSRSLAATDLKCDGTALVTTVLGILPLMMAVKQLSNIPMVKSREGMLFA